MLSWMPVMARESVMEIDQKRADKSTYLSVSGGFTQDSATEVGEWYLRNTTGITEEAAN